MNDVTHVAEELLSRSYAVFPLPVALRQVFAQIPGAYAQLSAEQKQAFSFPERLDGFLPFGAEHAADDPGRPDLCERFCHFRKCQDAHRAHPMASTTFYALIVEYEREIAELSHEVLHALFARLGGRAPEAPGAESYIQLCHYRAEYSANGAERSYLMDPHLDGQLLTFIVQTEQGLMVADRDGFQQIRFTPDQIFVMAGKLLEVATDQEIKGVVHAVGRNRAKNPRLSVMYFQNPSFESARYLSLRSGNEIDFLALANEIHQSYGLPAYK